MKITKIGFNNKSKDKHKRQMKIHHTKKDSIEQKKPLTK